MVKFIAGAPAVIPLKSVRIPLGFHERFATAVRATGKVGVLRLLTVVLLDERLGCERGDVHAAIGKIDSQLIVALPEFAIHSAAVAHVG